MTQLINANDNNEPSISTSNKIDIGYSGPQPGEWTTGRFIPQKTFSTLSSN